MSSLTSKQVDLKVFEEFSEAIGFTADLSELVYKMCQDFASFSACTDIEWPDYDTYGDNREAYWRAIEAVREAFYKKVAEVGYKYLDGDTSGEGGEEYCYGVFELKGVTYKAEYAYYSHQGHEYSSIEDTLRVVTPVQKIITVWE